MADQDYQGPGTPQEPGAGQTPAGQGGHQEPPPPQYIQQPPTQQYGQGQPQPPLQQPPSGQYYQGQPQAAPPYPAPPKKKGMNPWLLCGIITCSVILVVIIAIVVLGWQFAKPFLEMGQVMTNVEQADLATIQSEAIPVDEYELMNSCDEYKGKWLEVEGVIGGSYNDGSASSQQMPQDFTGQGGTVYTLESGLLVTDYSGGQLVGDEGDTIRAWGQITILHISDVPFMESVMEEMSPEERAMFENLTMFVAKEVELVEDEYTVKW